MSERDGIWMAIILGGLMLFGAFLAYTYLKSIVGLIILLVKDWKEKRKK